MVLTKVKTLTVVVLAFFLAAGVILLGRALAVPVAPQDSQELKNKKDQHAQPDLAKHNRTGTRKQLQADAQDWDKLQGIWVVVGVEEEGKKVPEQDVKEAKETFVIKGERMTYCRDGQVQVTMKFRLDSGKTPAVMDLVFVDSKEKGGNHAIYLLDGDMLKLRMNDKFGSNGVDERPTDFSTAQGKEAVLFILKRATKRTGTRKQLQTDAQVLDKLQGIWLVVGAEEEGKKVHEQDLKKAKETFVIKGATMTYCRDGRIQVTMKFRLDSGKKPAEMDLKFVDSNEKGYNHAIYLLDGDTLKLRMNDKFGNNSWDERPEDFSTAQGKQAVLFILKRGKK